jgi:diguanylate cyclase (GGDEF)-like protein
VLNVEHLAVDAFAPADRRVLEAFAHMVADVLERLDRIGETRRQISEQETVARLNQHLLRAEGAREAAAIALAELTRVLDLPASAVVSLRRGQLQPLAVGGSAPAGLRRLLQPGLPFEGLLRASWSGCRAELLDDALRDPRSEALARSSGVRALAIVPIANAAREVQALMLLADPRHPRAWSEADRRLIDIVAASLGVVLDRATLNQQLVAMLEVVRGLARADEPHELYARAAESVVRIVPGAEAASVLVRQADGLRYLGAYGYELPALARVGPISEEEERVWYRNGEEAYRRGVPRLARGAEIAALSAASAGELGPASLDAARVREIRANICVPISDHGTIVAVLNVDSMSSEDAFGRSALRLAEAFAQQVAVIVRQAQARESLRHSAVTDTLTGLGNREGFHRRLDLELQRARRYGHPLSLALLDLDNFKAVNDRLGHTRGDAALVQVAEVLRHEPRASDSAFRWGGDEFVVLLPELDRAAARRAAQRFAERIKGLAIDGLLLSASVGIASYPEDGKDREALLRRADDLMYRRKQSGQAGAAG